MTKKQMKEQAARIEMNGTLIDVSGNETWKHNWYRYNGFLVAITYKNGKLDEVNNYGR